MKFKTKVTFLISGEIHDEDFSIKDVLSKIDIKVKPWIDRSNRELWPYSGQPSPQIRKYTIESIKRIDE
jgi:hypothetical protein